MATETEHARRLPTTQAACDHVKLGKKITRIARHRSYIKLKFIKHFCSSWESTPNPRYHCIFQIYSIALISEVNIYLRLPSKIS
jgi:hypothetical protein